MKGQSFQEKPKQQGFVISGKQMSLNGQSTNKIIENKPALKPQTIKQQQQKQPLKKQNQKTVQTLSKQQEKQNQNTQQQKVEKTSEPNQEESKQQEQKMIVVEEVKKQEEIPIQREPVKGLVTVKYSHYKDKFPIIDGVLKEQAIDEQYCLSYVFVGNFQMKIRLENDPFRQYLEKPSRGIWSGLEDGKVYLLDIDEDPQQEEHDKKTSKPYVAFKPEECNLKNKKVEALSKELREMTTDEILQKGDKYKELIEARDLEDILFK